MGKITIKETTEFGNKTVEFKREKKDSGDLRYLVEIIDSEADEDELSILRLFTKLSDAKKFYSLQIRKGNKGLL